VAGQCSRNRCLARLTVRIPIVAAEAQQVEQLEERLLTGPDPRCLCPSGDRRSQSLCDLEKVIVIGVQE
jgi:hypothetical protein